MNFFKDMPISKKFFTIYSVIILAIIIIASFSINAITSSVSVANKIQSELHSHYIYPAQLNDNLDRFSRTIIEATNGARYNLKELDDLKALIKQEAMGLESDSKRDMVDKVQNNVLALEKLYMQDIRPALERNDIASVTNLIRGRYANLSEETTHACSAFLIAVFETLIDDTNMISSMTPAYTIITISIVSVVILIFFAIYSSKDFISVVNFIVKSAERIANLDLSHAIRTNRQDEFGSLQSSFEKLRVSFSEHISYIQATTEKVVEDANTVQGLMKSTAASASKSESSTLTVAAAADQMVSTSSDIARNCDTAAAASDSTREITNQSMHEVQDAIASIVEQTSRTQQDAALVQSFVTQSQNISSIVQTIGDIASQTNLLALNASIEAARAGEQGRGFAVVADEVRALAHRTASSTQEISNMVQQIQKEANAASESMNTSVEAMESLSTKASNIGSLLKNVLDNVNEVNAQITQIATAAEEQTTATSEISENMQGVASLLREVSGDTQHVNDTVVETSAVCHKLLNNVEVFKLEERFRDKKSLNMSLS